MATEVSVDLGPLTTLRVGGPARQLVDASSEAELIDAVRTVDEAGEPVLILGGGSNVLISDDGFDGTVIKVAASGIAEERVEGHASITVAAGENWDALVERAVDSGYSGGIEALAGIPGLVGATPIQNVGAYGAELCQLLVAVRAWDRTRNAVVELDHDACGFGYRWSRFKGDPGRFVICSVSLRLPIDRLSAPIAYGELARTLGVEVDARAPAAEVRQAVLGLRGSKGMVLVDDDHDTWSAGSFFTNPVLPATAANKLPPDAPRFPVADGMIKTSAAWLIEQAGFGKGYGNPPATLSTKHTLALTNRGGATAADLIRLARELRNGVRDRFGVTLEPEPVLVGCAL